MKFSFGSLRSITGVIVLINILVALYLWLHGVSFTSSKPIDLIIWGGNLGPLTLTSDPWRLFTSMFIHSGLLHLGLNMVLLLQVGPALEELVGKMRFITTYLLTGLFASLVSAVWYSHQAEKASQHYQSIFLEPSFIPTVSIGASGAIMGITATTLICAWWKARHHSANKNVQDIHWNSLAQVIVLNVGMGFFVSGVDNACHVGGVITGLLIGGIFLPANSLANQNLKRNDFIFVLSVGLLFLWILFPNSSSQDLLDISNDYRREVTERIREKTLIRRKDKAENLAIEEVKLIPAGVVTDAAVGASYIIEDGGPMDFSINPDESKAYIANSEGNNIQVVDLNKMEVIQTIQGPQFPKIKNPSCPDNACIGRGASDVALSQNGKWALVSSMEVDKIVKINLESNNIVWSVPAGIYPKKIIISPNEKWAYVLNGSLNKIAIIDLENRILKSNPFLSENKIVIYPNGRPLSMALSKKTNELFVVDTPGRQILTLDANNPGSFTRIKKIDSYEPTNILLSEDGKVIWLAGTDEQGRNVYKSYLADDFNEVDDFISCEIPLGQELDFHFAKNWIAIKSPNETSIRIVNAMGLITVRVLPATSHQTRLKFSSDGKYLFALSLQNARGVFTKYDVSKTIDVGDFVAQRSEVICLPFK